MVAVVAVVPVVYQPRPQALLVFQYDPGGKGGMPSEGVARSHARAARKGDARATPGFAGELLFDLKLHSNNPNPQSEVKRLESVPQPLTLALTVTLGRDLFNQKSNRSDREKWNASKGGPVFSKLFRLDRTDPLSFEPKFPEILVAWIAPLITISVLTSAA